MRPSSLMSNSMRRLRPLSVPIRRDSSASHGPLLRSPRRRRRPNGLTFYRRSRFRVKKGHARTIDVGVYAKTQNTESCICWLLPGSDVSCVRGSRGVEQGSTGDWRTPLEPTVLLDLVVSSKNIRTGDS